MEVVIRTGFQFITHKIAFQPQTMIKGENLVLAEHVREVEEHRKNNESYLIKSRVIRQASVHATPYTSSLYINATRHVTDVQCNCVYNQSKKCKHIAALIYFINNEESASKTSCEQQWGKPSARQFAKSKYSKGAYFEQMVPHKYIQLQKPQELHISELVSDSPLKQILKAKVEKSNIHTVNNVIHSLLDQVEINLEKEDCAACVHNFLIFCGEHPIYKWDYELDMGMNNFYVKNILLSEEDIVNLSCKTLEQSSCNEWHTARRLRFSASTNVHSVIVRSRKTIDSLVADILNPKQINSTSTKYGKINEPHAKDEYELLYDCIVKRVGVIVGKFQPWLCASLDGVVIEDGCISILVEFKCPISCEKKPVINSVDKSCNVKYLQFIDGKLVLKKTDLYYTQIQVQMYVSGMTLCDLFVYSPVQHGSCLVQVHRDEIFLEKAILKSEEFYFQYYLPALYTASITQGSANNDGDSSVRNVYGNSDSNMFDKDDKNNNKIISQMRTFTGRDISNIILQEVILAILYCRK